MTVLSKKKSKNTPPKINIEPENHGLEDGFPFPGGSLRFHVNLLGCIRKGLFGSFPASGVSCCDKQSPLAWLDVIPMSDMEQSWKFQWEISLIPEFIREKWAKKTKKKTGRDTFQLNPGCLKNGILKKRLMKITPKKNGVGCHPRTSTLNNFPGPLFFHGKKIGFLKNSVIGNFPPESWASHLATSDWEEGEGPDWHTNNIQYVYLEPKWPWFWLEKVLFWGLTFKNRGHLGSRYIVGIAVQSKRYNPNKTSLYSP